MNSRKISVTQPDPPPLDEFIEDLRKIWGSKILTNSGEFHQRLEEQLCEYLGVEYISLFNNGTIALICAIRSLGLRGEIITTPFSFVATASSIIWANCTPVFVDIDEDSFNISPSAIERAVTDHTCAIMPVHCYGFPCDVEAIESIATRHKLKVIYDAAHAFGVECHCGSILNHGDLSVLSFHATKTFSTIEGGAVVCRTLQQKQELDLLKNFGFTGEVSVSGVGINGKLNEVCSAFGIRQLGNFYRHTKARERVHHRYLDNLRDVSGIKVSHLRPDLLPRAHNYGYFPAIVSSGEGEARDRIHSALKDRGIYSRRYFYPLISEFSDYQGYRGSNTTPLAWKLSREVLCLPIHSQLGDDQVDYICESILGSLRDNS